MKATVRDRLYARLIIDPSGCLLWTGARNSDGYGNMSVGGQKRYVHRLAYEIAVGPIPDGMQLDHLCRVRNCANVAHLEPVTCRENLLRSTESIAAANAAKTCCGICRTPFDEANTYWVGRSRYCRACHRTRERERVQRIRSTETTSTA